MCGGQNPVCFSLSNTPDLCDHFWFFDDITMCVILSMILSAHIIQKCPKKFCKISHTEGLRKKPKINDGSIILEILIEIQLYNLDRTSASKF